MPKHTIEFNLPEENNELKLALRASEYYGVIWDTLQQIRCYLKYGHQFKSIEEALESIQELLLEVNIDDIK